MNIGQSLPSFRSLIIALIVVVAVAFNKTAWSLDRCPEGTQSLKVHLMWADKGLMQTFDCVKDGRREYILLLGERGHAEAMAMIPDGASVPQIVQFREYDAAGTLRSTKKFGMTGLLTRLERFSDKGVLILRYLQETSHLEEFSATTPGERKRDCKLEISTLTDTTRVAPLEVQEQEMAGVRSVMIDELNDEGGRKTLFRSEAKGPMMTGEVLITDAAPGIERCFISMDEKKLVGYFQWGNKKLLIPRDAAYPLSIMLQHLKSPRSEEAKAVLERFELR